MTACVFEQNVADASSLDIKMGGAILVTPAGFNPLTKLGRAAEISFDFDAYDLVVGR